MFDCAHIFDRCNRLPAPEVFGFQNPDGYGLHERMSENPWHLNDSSVAILKLLLNHGLDRHINYQYKKLDKLNTLMHWAVICNKNFEIVPLLMSYGADPYIENKKGITPYMLAKKNMRYLIEASIIKKNLNQALPEGVNKKKQRL